VLKSAVDNHSALRRNYHLTHDQWRTLSCTGIPLKRYPELQQVPPVFPPLRKTGVSSKKKLKNGGRVGQAG
jgi:hypothetical protein